MFQVYDIEFFQVEGDGRNNGAILVSDMYRNSIDLAGRIRREREAARHANDMWLLDRQLSNRNEELEARDRQAMNRIEEFERGFAQIQEAMRHLSIRPSSTSSNNQQAVEQEEEQEEEQN